MAVTPAKLKSFQSNWEDATAARRCNKLIDVYNKQLLSWSYSQIQHMTIVSFLLHSSIGENLWKQRIMNNLLFSERFGVEYSSDGVITNVSR